MVQTVIVKIYKAGRITLPERVREVEDIKPNDLLQITVEKIKKPIPGM